MHLALVFDDAFFNLVEDMVSKFFREKTLIHFGNRTKLEAINQVSAEIYFATSLLRDSTSYTTWKIAICLSHALCGNLPAGVLGTLVSLIQLGDVELGSLQELDLANKNILEGIDALEMI
jgi:hypothetical protein